MCDIDNIIMQLKSINQEIYTEHKKLYEELSICDKEKSDIEHYIEFFNFNAAQGYKAFKMLKDVLQNRREIKKKIEKCELLMSAGIKNYREGSRTINACEKVNHKKYTPRILNELFGEQKFESLSNK